MQAITLKSVEIYDVETRQEKRSRTLKHLIKLNHANHAILFHDLEFHNHMPHVWGQSSYGEAQLICDCSCWGLLIFLEQTRIISTTSTSMNLDILILGRIRQEKFHVMIGETI